MADLAQSLAFEFLNQTTNFEMIGWTQPSPSNIPYGMDVKVSCWSCDFKFSQKYAIEKEFTNHYQGHKVIINFKNIGIQQIHTHLSSFQITQKCSICNQILDDHQFQSFINNIPKYYCFHHLRDCLTASPDFVISSRKLQQ